MSATDSGFRVRGVVCGWEHTVVLAEEQIWTSAQASAPAAAASPDGGGGVSRTTRGVLYGTGDNSCGQLGIGHCDPCLQVSLRCLLVRAALLDWNQRGVTWLAPGRGTDLRERATAQTQFQRAALGEYDVVDACCGKAMTAVQVRVPIDAPCPQCLRHTDPMHAHK
jgi:hypothetical protein